MNSHFAKRRKRRRKNLAIEVGDKTAATLSTLVPPPKETPEEEEDVGRAPRAV